MQIINRSVFVAVLAGLTLAACGEQSSKSSAVKPAKVEKLDNGFSRLILTERAVERLGIQIAAVREEPVKRTRKVGGEVVALPTESTMVLAPGAGTINGLSLSDTALAPGRHLAAGDPVLELATFSESGQGRELFSLTAPRDAALLRVLVEPGEHVVTGQALFEVANISAVWVRVRLVDDPSEVALDQPARVLPLTRGDDETGLTAEPIQGPSRFDPRTLYYAVSGPKHGLIPGSRVMVELTLAGSGAQRQVVPFSSVIYGPTGDTWVYTSPEPLEYVRHLITVDYIDGDIAVLSAGPPTDTAIVAVGATELFGLEFGIGK